MDAELVVFKVTAATFTLAVACIGVALPFALRRLSRVAKAMSLANMLSAGVMLGGGFLHLLPEAVESTTSEDSGIESDFPFAFLAFSLGLLLPLFVETLVQGGHVHRHSFSRSLLDDDQRRSAAAACDDHLGEPELSNPVAPGADGAHCIIVNESGSNHSSVGEDEADEVAQLSRLPLMSVVVFQAALSFHSLLEGLGQGAAPTPQSAAEILLLITMHKGLTAFALGSSLLHAPLPARVTLILCGIFVSATPLGVLVGTALATAQLGVWADLVLALSAGTFVYVALCEIMPRELQARRAPRAAQLAATAIGFAAMAVLAIWV